MVWLVVVTGVGFESELVVGFSIAFVFTCKFDDSAEPMRDLDSSELFVKFCEQKTKEIKEKKLKNDKIKT